MFQQPLLKDDSLVCQLNCHDCWLLLYMKYVEPGVSRFSITGPSAPVQSAFANFVNRTAGSSADVSAATPFSVYRHDSGITLPRFCVVVGLSFHGVRSPMN